MKALHSFALSILFIGSLAILTSSCKKSDPAPATRTEMLTKTWKVNQVYLDNKPDHSTNYTTFRMTFNVDGTYTYTGNGITEQGTWEFNSTEQQIILDKGTPKEKVLTIIKLEGIWLEYTYTGSNYKTGSMEVKMQYHR